MALINRLSRLFRADFHAVLDQIEEPEVLLKQAIRDMEDDLANTEQRIKVCARDQDVLSGRRDELESSIADTDSQLDLCFESAKDDLARSLIRKKLEAGRLLKRLMTRFEANARHLDEQKKMLEENRTTLESLRQKAELFTQHASVRVNSRCEFDDNAWMARELAVDDDEIEIAFLREKTLRSAS